MRRKDLGDYQQLRSYDEFGLEGERELMAKKAKKTAGQVKIEQRIAKLKTEHGTLSKQKRVLEKRLDRENKAVNKKLDVIEKQLMRLEDQRSALENGDLPSEKAKRKLTDKLVKIEEKIRAEEHMLRQITAPPPPPSSAPRPDREAGDEEE